MRSRTVRLDHAADPACPDLANMRQTRICAGIGKPEDIAKACLYLASDDANYVTGTTLVSTRGGSTKQDEVVQSYSKRAPRLRNLS